MLKPYEENKNMVTITTGEYAMLIECQTDMEMLQRAMRNYMKLWSVDSQPSLDDKFLVVLKAVFPYAYEETLAKLRIQKKEEEVK